MNWCLGELSKLLACRIIRDSYMINNQRMNSYKTYNKTETHAISFTFGEHHCWLSNEDMVFNMVSGDFLVRDCMSYVALIGDSLSGDFMSGNFLTWIHSTFIMASLFVLKSEKFVAHLNFALVISKGCADLIEK